MITITEKINSISEGMLDYTQSIPEKWWKSFVEPELRGYQKPGVGPTIAMGAAAKAGREALARGAGPGAMMGAAGGGLLGAGFASGGLVAPTFSGGWQGARRAMSAGVPRSTMGPLPSGQRYRGPLKKRLFSALAQGLFGAGKGALKSAGLATAGAGAGALGGGVAGWRGGRQTGAGILGAGMLGGPAGLAIGPVSSLAAGGIGAFQGADIMKAIEQSRQRLARGGGSAIFRDVQSSR